MISFYLKNKKPDQSHHKPPFKGALTMITWSKIPMKWNKTRLKLDKIKLKSAEETTLQRPRLSNHDNKLSPNVDSGYLTTVSF